MSSRSASRRVAVIGGGISGLATAYELVHQQLPGGEQSTITQQHGLVDFVLFEATDRLGGIVETVRRDGFVIEGGPDAWVTEKPWARELAIELGLEAEIISSNDARRRTLILERGQLVPMPDGMRMMVPTDLDSILSSSLFTEEAKNGYLSEPARAEELKAAVPEADESVANFVRRHFGDEVAVKVAGPLLSGVFGGSIERLSVHSVMPAFVKMEREYGSLILALQARAKASAKEPPAIFTSLKSGLGTLVDAIVATLPPGAIRLNTEIVSLAVEGPQWRVKSAGGTECFDAVVLATPTHVTRQLLTPVDARWNELLHIDASSAIVVAFAFTGDAAAAIHMPEGFGFLAPPPLNKASHAPPSLLACTFVNQKFPHRTPEGGVLLRAFYGGDQAPALLVEPDESLVSSAAEQLRAVLGPLPQPAFTVVRRWPRSLPQYEVGHQARVDEIERLAARFPCLHLAGNGYHGVGLPDLVRDGRAIATGMLSQV